MKQYMIAFFAIAILIFSGCSSSNSEVDITGNGLETSFKISEKQIQTGIIEYELTFKNSGTETIFLNPENTKLTTRQVLFDQNDIIQDVFTQESIDMFYDKVFPQGEKYLEHDITHGAQGVLEIEKEFFDNFNNDELEFYLDINYDYTTKFSNNLQLNYENGIFKLNVLDSAVSQAAPLQITKIELVPDRGENQYVLEYSVVDKGKSSDISPATLINDLNINFRSSYLGSCKGTYEGKRDLDLDEIAVRKGENLIIRCPIQLTGEDSLTTKTFGEFSYNYKMRFKETVKLPKEN